MQFEKPIAAYPIPAANISSSRLPYSHGLLLYHIPFCVPASILGDLFHHAKKDPKECRTSGLLAPLLCLG